MQGKLFKRCAHLLYCLCKNRKFFKIRISQICVQSLERLMLKTKINKHENLVKNSISSLL